MRLKNLNKKRGMHETLVMAITFHKNVVVSINSISTMNHAILSYWYQLGRSGWKENKITRTASDITPWSCAISGSQEQPWRVHWESEPWKRSKWYEWTLFQIRPATGPLWNHLEIRWLKAKWKTSWVIVHVPWLGLCIALDTSLRFHLARRNPRPVKRQAWWCKMSCSRQQEHPLHKGFKWSFTLYRATGAK